MSSPSVVLEEHPSDTSIKRIVVSGEIDLASAPALRGPLGEAVKEPGAGVIVDMSGCLFIDSTGLSLLLNAMRRLVRTGGAIAVLCPNPTPARLFQITKTDATLNLVDSEEDALAAIERGRNRGP